MYRVEDEACPERLEAGIVAVRSAVVAVQEVLLDLCFVLVDEPFYQAVSFLDCEVAVSRNATHLAL